MLIDEELDQVCDVLIEHEGLIPWLYCDSRGFVTVGVGDKVTDLTVVTMPFVCQADGLTPATTEQKLSAFIRVQDFFQKGLTAGAYRACSDLRLDPEFCRRRLAYRIKSEFVPAIEKQCSQFAIFPLSVKLVLIDIAYNVGVAGFAAFQQLIAACNARHFAEAASQVHTAREGEDPQNPDTWGKRNTWRRITMLQAERVA